MIKKRKTDIIIILILIIIALISYFIINFYNNSSVDVKAELSINGKTVKTFSLDEDKIFTDENLPHIEFEIKDKKIRFLNSDCPDKICVNTGFIGIVGQTAVCLPNLASLKIVPIDTNNQDNENLDVISK